MKPSTQQDAEERDKAEANLDLLLLRAMIDNPNGTQAEWGNAIGRAKGRVNAKLQKLKKLKLVEEGLGKWQLTPKGTKEALAL
jgi:hypothetical protein